MGREKRNLPAPVVGGPKERHKRAQRSQYDPKAPVPEGFVAKPTIPKSKHHSYFEFVENKEKKKKLEFQITSAKTPPPGFEFVPTGNPSLTTACKELSRDKDAMIFIVSNSKEVASNHLAHQVHRIGHHIRETIVEEARQALGNNAETLVPVCAGSPEPIPESQEEYDAQVDAAIRDLFPRVPNTDRQMIIEHSFRKGTKPRGDKPVGLSSDITLARRVQLAVLAHIRHTHTRYDTLLKETTWQNARKVVEALCLDTLVKWRGDEETGRDQLDEILREVVVISDSEDDDSDMDTDGSSVEETEPPTKASLPQPRVSNGNLGGNPRQNRSSKPPQNLAGSLNTAKPKGKVKKSKRKDSTGKKTQRGLKRYHAWEEACRRFRQEQDIDAGIPPTDRNVEYVPYPQQAAFGSTTHHGPGGPSLKVVSQGLGPAPNENGFVGQRRPTFARPLDHQPHVYTPPRISGYEKVTTPQNAMSVNSPHVPRQAPMATHRLQDMLVRSIEPVSPDTMKPSFVRAMPPRTQGYRDCSPRTNTQFPSRLEPGQPSSPRGRPTGDEPFGWSSRPNGSFVPGNRPPLREYDNRAFVRDLAQDVEPVNASHSIQRTSASTLRSSDVPIPVTRPLHTDGAPFVVMRDVLRPGGKSNPIVMEDRGGFYERVSGQPESIPLLPQGAGFIEVRRPVRQSGRQPEHHRVVSWDEGSRVIKGPRDPPHFEGIPAAYHAPAERRRQLHAEPRMNERLTPDQPLIARHMTGSPYSGYYHEAAPEPQLVPSDPRAPRYENYRDVRHEQRPLAPYSPQQQQQQQRHYSDEPPAVYTQPVRRRGFPLRPHRPEDVIVLD